MVTKAMPLALLGLASILSGDNGDGPTEWGAEAQEESVSLSATYSSYGLENVAKTAGVDRHPDGYVDYSVRVPSHPAGSDFQYEGSHQICLQTDAEPLRPNGVTCEPLLAAEPEDDDDEPPADEPEEFVTVRASDFVKLPLQGSGIQVQPARPWVLVNKDTIVFTSADPQVLNTQVLGHPVAVRATPIEFTWNFGQGSTPFSTDHPGAPYPEHTISYAYLQTSQAESVQLTTTWAGEFQVNGQGPLAADRGHCPNHQ